MVKAVEFKLSTSLVVFSQWHNSSKLDFCSLFNENVHSKGSLFASNVARGNWTSPVLSSCPSGLLAVNQQDIEDDFYKNSYNVKS
jgi:hypothetical protein